MKKRTLAHENDWYYNNYIMRLLIVEDENDLRNIVKKRLVKEHYSVDACGDGLEAMAYIDMTSYDGFRLLNSEIGNDHMRGCNRIYQQHICNFIIIRGVFSLFPPIIPKMV